MAFKGVGRVVILESFGNVLGLANIECAAAVLQDIDPEHENLAPHSGRSSQLFLDANDRNAQFIQKLARRVLVRQDDSTLGPRVLQPNSALFRCKPHLLAFVVDRSYYWLFSLKTQFPLTR